MIDSYNNHVSNKNHLSVAKRCARAAVAGLMAISLSGCGSLLDPYGTSEVTRAAHRNGSLLDQAKNALSPEDKNGGPSDYGACSLDQLLDKNWLQPAKLDSNNKISNLDRIGMERGVTRSEVEQIATIDPDEGGDRKVLKNDLVDGMADSDKIGDYIAAALNANGPLNIAPADRRENLDNINQSQKAFADNVIDTFYNGDDAQAVGVDASVKNYQIVKVPYSTAMDTYGVQNDSGDYTVYHYTGRMKDKIVSMNNTLPNVESLYSIATWMLYEGGFYDVHVSPSGVWGKCRFDDKGYQQVTQIVLPSNDDPNKYDVFVDNLEAINRYGEHFRKIKQEQENYDDDLAFLDAGQDIALYAKVLRTVNHDSLPFRVVLHDVDRPLRAKDNEIVRVANKFGLTEEVLNNDAKEMIRHIERNQSNIEGLRAQLLGLNDSASDYLRQLFYLEEVAPYNKSPASCVDNYEPTMRAYDRLVKTAKEKFGN